MAKLSKRGRKAPPQARRKTLAPGKASAPRKSGDATFRQQLAESRAQQAATAAILKVIARSPSDVQPVFDAIAKNAMRILRAWSAIVVRFDGELLHFGAARGALPDTEQQVRQSFPVSPHEYNRFGGRAIIQRSAQQIPDCRADADPQVRKVARLRGFRASLSVPILRAGKPLGSITVTRAEPGAFPKSEVDLLRAFADQAVIAIENVRRFNETKEALERQTATADILRAISGSPTDTQPVFEVILDRATKLCDAQTGILFRYADGAFQALATRVSNPEFAEMFKEPRRPEPGSKTGLGRLIREKRTVHIHDLLQDAATAAGDPMRLQTLRGGVRTWLGVPLLKDGEMIGAILVYRSEPRPFAEQQISLLETFADQAVIAIENVRLFNETREALERQTATAEILKVIASSPTDLQPVLDAIAENAARVCGAEDVLIWRVYGGSARIVAKFGPFPSEQIGHERALVRGRVSDRAVIDRETIHVHDLAAAETEFPDAKAGGLKWGVRTALATPLMRDGVSIGAIHCRRMEVRPFTDKQIDLLKTFADQAVIAIENVRLFNETKEALERQTATGEVLKAISRTTFDLDAVLRVLIESATRLAGASRGFIFRFDGAVARMAVSHNAPPGYVALIEANPIPPGRGTLVGRTLMDCLPVHIPDALVDPEFQWREAQRLGGFRSMLGVPMMREGSPIGVIAMWSEEVKPFTDKQIELVTTFADQAVIAIENVRLFNETKESLERQTATAEILKVISSSPTDEQPVFDAIVESAERLFTGRSATVWILDGENLVRQAGGSSHDEMPRFNVLPADRDSLVGKAVLDGSVMQLTDTLGADATVFARRNRGTLSYRAMCAAPLLREGKGIGVISVSSPEPGALSDKQRQLLQTFADQAVIAIENVRLFKELEARNRDVTEALERQTATADILKVIAGSQTDVQPVLDAIVESAARLFSPCIAGILMREGDRVFLRGIAGPANANYDALSKLYPIPFDPRASIAALVMANCQVIEVMDSEGPDTTELLRATGRAAGFRSITEAPLVRGGEGIGVITISSPQPGYRLSEKQRLLLKTFADQAVIAIENVRLFNETKEALERQTATAEILKVIASSPSDVQPVLDAVAQSAAKLCAATDAIIHIKEGDKLRLSAHFGEIATKQSLGQARLLSREWFAGLAAVDGRQVHIHDIQAVEREFPISAEIARHSGHRTALATPLIREGIVLGVISIRRTEVRPFTEKQIDLLNTFASQAVIAIANVRLFNETREALERQTATAEILKVISGSPTNVQPVFDAIVRSAARLFDPCVVTITMLENGLLQWNASAGMHTDPKAIEKAKDAYPLPFDPSRSPSSRAIQERRIIEIMDVAAPDAPDSTRRVAQAVGFRSACFVPLIRENEGIGTIVLTRREPGYKLSDEQLALFQTFADQAVIAIENVRLFKELQSRTEALTKSVGQLTALGEVGQAISSTLDLETVLQTIVSHAVKLTGVDAGAIYEYDEQAEAYRLQAAQNMAPELVEAVRKTPIRKGDGATGRTAETLEPVQVPDIQDESYQGSRKDNLMRTGYRSVLAVPLLREDHLLGAIQVFRRTPGAFAPEIVELLKTFATQSAMAIQNARLFREIAEKGKQLELASQHKSNFLASMSHELRTPLNAILGFNEMILGQVYGEVSADMQPPLAQIQTSGKHLLRLINNVLDLAKIEAGRMELSLQDYSVHDTVASVQSILRPLAAEKGLALLATLPDDLPLAYGDSGRIAQCLMNLAGNSLKFTKEGKVEISVEAKGEILVYKVADTGIGIPPDKIASLFTEFKQTDATVASEYGGTGLGLSISKKFIEMHGGRIWIESELGKGSAFIFEVPLRVTTP